MSDEETTKSPLRDHAETILKMTKEAERVKRRIGAQACVVIGIFRDGDTLRFQDAGRFPVPPDHFYEIMKQAHVNGQMGLKDPKVKLTSRIIKPH